MTTCTCTPDRRCLFCDGGSGVDPNNPFDDAGALVIERIMTQGVAAYGAEWAALQTHLVETHSNERTRNLNALRHREALAIIRTIATECPHVFAMKKNWKPAHEYKDKPKRKPTAPLGGEWTGVPDPPRVVDSEPCDILIDRNPYPGDVAKFRQHLARRILSGELTHAELVRMGTVNGYDGVRLGCEDDDGRGEVWARAIDSSLRHNERQFLLMVKRSFSK